MMKSWFQSRRLVLIISISIVVVCFSFVRSSWYPSATELKRRCQDAIEANDWPQVETLAASWAAADPGSGEPWLQWAESLKRQRKYQLALNCLSRIPPTARESETGLLAQMELQFGPLNRPIEGAETCETILTVNPHSTVARQRLIFFLAMTLQRTRLAQQIRQAIDTGSEPIEAYVYFFFTDALLFSNAPEWTKRWRQGDPDSELLTAAEAVFTAESLDLSISMDDATAAQSTRYAASRKAAILQQLLSKFPHNAELLAYQIRQSIQTGDLSRVVNLLAQTTVEEESDHRFWRFKGWVHAQRGQKVDAEMSYRRAIELHPMDWATRNLFAELLQQEKRFDEVKSLRDLVTRGNDLHHDLQHEPNARQVAPAILKRLADFAADCGDKQISDGLHRRIQQNATSQGS